MEPQHLLHITHARQDDAWVHGVLLPALGLAEGQYWTRAEDDVGALKLEELERAVKSCRYTLLVASSAAHVDEWTQFAGTLAQHLGARPGADTMAIVVARPAPHPDVALRAALDALDPRLGPAIDAYLGAEDEPAARAALVAATVGTSFTGIYEARRPHPVPRSRSSTRMSTSATTARSRSCEIGSHSPFSQSSRVRLFGDLLAVLAVAAGVALWQRAARA